MNTFLELQERRAEAPGRFSQGTLDKTISPFQENVASEDRFAPTEFPLFRLLVSQRRYRPIKPIKIHVYKSDEWFFAENDNLDVTGTGISFEAAILDLEQHIVHFWNYYQRLSNDQLIGDAVRFKNTYSNLLIEE